MSRSKEYQRLLNSRKWKELRMQKLAMNPLCEICKKKGLVVAAIDCHHIKPVESASSEQEMELLAYSLTNLMSLCIPCHAAIHKQGKSHSRESHRQRASEDLQRWIERHKRKN